MKLGTWRATPGTDLEDCGVGQTFPHSSARQLGLYKPISWCGRDRSKEGVRPGIQPNSAASNRAPKTLGPLQLLPEHSTSLTSPLLPNTQSHLPGRGRQANLARGRSRSSIIKHESPTHLAPNGNCDDQTTRSLQRACHGTLRRQQLAHPHSIYPFFLLNKAFCEEVR